MGPSKFKSTPQVAALVWVGLLATLSGCGRDAALTARITGSAITNSPATNPSPMVDAPPDVVMGRRYPLGDANSQGGTDVAGLVPSGSINVNHVSVGGDVRKSRGTSASFKVSGGIYVQ